MFMPLSTGGITVSRVSRGDHDPAFGGDDPYRLTLRVESQCDGQVKMVTIPVTHEPTSEYVLPVFDGKQIRVVASVRGLHELTVQEKGDRRRQAVPVAGLRPQVGRG